MKYITLFSLIFVSTIIFAQKNDSFQLKPIGFESVQDESQSLKGGGAYYLKYQWPNINIDNPNNLPKLEEESYSKILLGFIKSLLFEYKNYSGQENLTAYTFFSLGNYSSFSSILLEYANKVFLPNQSLLKKLYQWAMPYYKTAYNSITVEEQQILIDKLTICDKYLYFVIDKNDLNAYEKWLTDNKFSDDIKATGFLKRRIDKNQWTIEDCKYWIAQLKTDFIPLLKNKDILQSHYQITDKIYNSLYIATNHKGDYGLLDSSYNPIENFHYRYIKKNDNTTLYAYNTLNTRDYRKLHLEDYEKYGYFPKPLIDGWNDSYNLTNNTIYFETKEFKGIYDFVKNIYILDSCINVFFFNESKLLVACNNNDYPNEYFLYDYFGAKLSLEKVKITEMFFEDEDFVEKSVKFITLLNTSKDSELIIFLNEDNKVGVINNKGSIILPFKYDSILFSENEDFLIATDPNINEVINYNRQGELIKN